MKKILVAYFSAEGNTAKVAAKLAEAASADLFEIKPSEPYTAADINWKNPLSRCNREKFGKKDVPIACAVENFEDYGLVFLGFPIWYYAAPNIINTFVKEYDWSGKRIALFATSGGSDISKSPDKLRPYLNGKGEIVGARLFRPDADKQELEDWARPFAMPWTTNAGAAAHNSRSTPEVPGEYADGLTRIRTMDKDFEVAADEYKDRFNRMRNMTERDFPEYEKK